MTTSNEPGVFDGPEGSTPLGPDDIAGLKPSSIATRADLNAAEQENILAATLWAHGRSWSRATLLTSDALRAIHRRMFSDVWTWAGEWRKKDTNLGVDWWDVPPEVKNLCDDVLAQTVDLTNLPWPADEIAIRFHHRLVFVHPFTNGNGRHARLAADLFAGVLGEPPFTWGRVGSMVDASAARDAYLAALRVADSAYEYAPLLTLARS